MVYDRKLGKTVFVSRYLISHIKLVSVANLKYLLKILWNYYHQWHAQNMFIKILLQHIAFFKCYEILHNCHGSSFYNRVSSTWKLLDRHHYFSTLDCPIELLHKRQLPVENTVIYMFSWSVLFPLSLLKLAFLHYSVRSFLRLLRNIYISHPNNSRSKFTIVTLMFSPCQPRLYVAKKEN